MFDPASEATTTLVSCEDGHARERALPGQVLAQVSVPAKARRDGSPGLKLRRIRIGLERPARHGDSELCVLTTLAPAVAHAATLARLCRQRWSIERAFLHLTTELRCEVHTLSCPPAALFALACAVVAFNGLAVIKAALRAAHGAEIEQALSSHAMASDLGNMAQSLKVIVDAQDWEVFRLASLPAMAAWLLDQARRVSLRRYATKASARKEPPKPPVKRLHDPNKPRVALSRPLAAHKAAAP